METYHLTATYKSYYQGGVLIGIILLGVFIRVFTFSMNDQFMWYAYYIVAIIFSFVVSTRRINDESITISEQNITYTLRGTTFQASWDDIKGIEKVLTSLFIKQDCLIVDQSHIRIVSTSLFGNPSPRIRGWDSQKAVIPLTQFSDPWREKDLGVFIRRYAPHLFEIKVNL
jgi:hypothetical protein